MNLSGRVFEIYRIENKKNIGLLAAFPYVNGGLFADDDIEIPPFTEDILALLVRKASHDFDWSGISPTIFGAVFESTLNPETRRAGGMHYTSIENIHKVIDPLFLDDLKAELEEISGIAIARTKEKKLREFQDNLASLCWLEIKTPLLIQIATPQTKGVKGWLNCA